MQNQFDVKTNDLIVCNGQVVMSRTEEPILERLFTAVAHHAPKAVLEVGYGLGISAGIIQRTFRPKYHDIVEIDRTIFQDLQAFARRRKGVMAIDGDFWSFKPTRKYDFIFFDPFDYLEDERDYDEDELDEYDKVKSERMRELIEPNGIVCCPNLGEGPPESMPGFKRTLHKRLGATPFLIDEGTMSTKASVVCWKRH